MALSKSNKQWLLAIILMVILVALIDYVAGRYHGGHSTIINTGLKNKTPIQ